MNAAAAVSTARGEVIVRAARRGDVLVVRFGGKARQLAQVLGPVRDRGRLPVRKWRANSGTWTLQTFVDARSIVAAGTDAYAYAEKVLPRGELDRLALVARTGRV